MSAETNVLIHHGFSRAGDYLSPVDGNAAAYLIAAGSDISLILSREGVVVDVAYRDADLAGYAPESWIGKQWVDTVTPECVGKVDAMLAGGEGASLRRQVNHPAPGRDDLPVEYALIEVPGLPVRVAIGDDLSKIADVQQRLVRTQVELEAEYGAIREAESRYRTFFYMSERPGLIVEAASRRILDANPAAARMFGRPAQRLIGAVATSLFARSERDRVGAILYAVQHSGDESRADVTLDGDAAVSMLVQAYRENGRNNLLVRLTSPEAAGSLAAPGPTAGRNMIELSPEAMAVTDLEGVVLDVNEAFLDSAQIVNRDRVVGRHLSHWLGASSIDLQVLLTKAQEERRVRMFSTVLRDELDRERSVQASAMLVEEAAGETVSFLIFETGGVDSMMSMPSGASAQDASEFAELVGRVPLKELIRQSVEMIERLCIEAALRQTQNNRAAASELLGLSRQSLYIKLKRYNFDDTSEPG